ncbi:MAG: BACON domain-containing protein [Micrococcales bacterium]|nr:BACON domain-containing protein [Micrococcales bacterium]
MKIVSKTARLFGTLVATGWVVVCALTVTVQVAQPPVGPSGYGVPEATVQAGTTQGLSVDVPSWAVGAEGGQLTATVVTHQGWQAVSNQGWLQVAGGTGGEEHLVLTAGSNTDDMRTAIVTVTSGGETVYIHVAQTGAVVDATAPPQTTEDASSDPPAGPTVDPPARVQLPTDPMVKGAINLVPGNPPVVSGYIIDTAAPNDRIPFWVLAYYATPDGGEETVRGPPTRTLANLPDPMGSDYGYSYAMTATGPQGGALTAVCVTYAAPTRTELLGCVEAPR